MYDQVPFATTMSGTLWIYTLSVVLILIQRQSINVCAATLCSPPCLLVSNTSDIVAIDYKTTSVNPVVSGLTRAVAIDVHFTLGYTFWSDVTEQEIKRFRIGGSPTTIISGIGVCGGLAVDWRTSQLYWTDQSYDKISVSDLDGNNQRSLISSGLDAPRAIALDPDNGLMIWTDLGTYPKIEKASLSGAERVTVVTTDLKQPNGIELDKGNKRIFWVDAGYDRVESVEYNGSNRKILFHLDGLHPYGVVLIAPFLFFTDWNTHREVYKLDATTGEVLRSYSINGGRPMGIVAYDSTRQPSGRSPCAANNGGCSHFCVTKTSSYECVCPTGLTVRQDGKTCEDRVRTFILFADADDNSMNYISLDVNYFVSQTLFSHLESQRPMALDFDPTEDRVYWSDVDHGRIFSAFSNGTSLKTLFHFNVQSPEGLAIDHVGRNIYWTDTGTNRIEVGRLDGTSRKLLIKDGLDEPRAIVLDERNGMMYWADCGANPKIEQAEMDGSARRAIIIGNLVWPNGLTIDQATNRLFWADANLDQIEFSDLNGQKRKLITSSLADIHPYGLAVHQDKLYWTDWNTKSISRVNLSSGKQETIVYGLKKPMDIHVFDPSLIFSGPHNCSQNNGFCSDFCLLKPGRHQCACPTGIALKSDGKNCDYAVTCVPLKTPPRALVLNDSCGNTHGSNCVFGCQSGFVKADGNVTRTCLQTGNWSGNPIYCIAVTCVPLKIPPRALVLNGSCGNTYGSNCVFGCRSGFVKVGGNVTRTCLQTGKWSGNPIYCIRTQQTPSTGKEVILEHKSSLAIAVGSTTAVFAFLAATISVAVLCMLKRGFLRWRLYIREENVGENNQGYDDGDGNQNNLARSVELQLANHGIRRSPVESSQIDAASSDTGATAGSSTSATPDERGSGEDPVTEKHCICISHLVGVDWKKVLRKLSMAEITIRNLDEDYKHCEVAEKCYQGLLKWKESFGPQGATIKKLCDALQNVGCSEALEALRRMSHQSDC